MSWERIHGSDIQPGHAERSIKNENRMKDDAFRKACERAEIEPTRRQASKWNNKKGKAYKMSHRIPMTGIMHG